MKKNKIPTLAAIVIGAILMISGPLFTVQNADACTSKKIYQSGSKFLWDCVGSTGNTCGRCVRY